VVKPPRFLRTFACINISATCAVVTATYAAKYPIEQAWLAKACPFFAFEGPLVMPYGEIAAEPLSQPVIEKDSPFVVLVQICILTSVTSFGLSQCRISRAKAFHQFILIVLGQ
jgi:hypothetical protein